MQHATLIVKLLGLGLAISLLWNLGNGMMISYTYLLHSLHAWQSGLPLNAQVKARRTSFENLRLQTSLTEADLNRSLTGINYSQLSQL